MDETPLNKANGQVNEFCRMNYIHSVMGHRCFKDNNSTNFTMRSASEDIIQEANTYYEISLAFKEEP